MSEKEKEVASPDEESVDEGDDDDAESNDDANIEYTQPLDEECDFYVMIPFSYTFKNYIEICKKINKELQILLYKKSGIIFFISNLSTKQVLIETIFNKECFSEFFCNTGRKLLTIELNGLFKIIKNIKKGNSIQFIKYKSEPNLRINILKNSQIAINDKQVFYNFYGKKTITKSCEYDKFSFGTDNFNTDLYEISNMKGDLEPEFSPEFFIDSLFFSKFITNLSKKKLNKIKFSFYKENYFTIETKYNSFNFNPTTDNLIIFGKEEDYNASNVPLCEVNIPNNIFYFFTKIKNISPEGSVFRLKPVNDKSFILEINMSNLGIFRVCFRNKN